MVVVLGMTRRLQGAQAGVFYAVLDDHQGDKDRCAIGRCCQEKAGDNLENVLTGYPPGPYQRRGRKDVRVFRPVKKRLPAFNRSGVPDILPGGDPFKVPLTQRRSPSFPSTMCESLWQKQQRVTSFPAAPSTRIKVSVCISVRPIMGTGKVTTTRFSQPDPSLPASKKLL